MADILIIDDDKLICWSLQEIIAQLGHQSEIARTSAEAKEYLMRKKFDLIFFDIEIKEESSLQILKETETLQPGSRIVILSALNKDQIEAEIANFKIFTLLEKPFDSNQIREIVSAALDQGDKG